MNTEQIIKKGYWFYTTKSFDLADHIYDFYFEDSISIENKSKISLSASIDTLLNGNFLVLLSVVFKKFELIANEFLSSVSFSISASSTLALYFISFTLAIKISMFFVTASALLVASSKLSFASCDDCRERFPAHLTE